MDTARERNLGIAARIAAIALAVLFGMVVLCAPAQAFEGQQLGKYKSGTYYYMIDYAVPDNTIIALSDPKSKNKVSAVKSNNTKVAQVNKYTYGMTIHLTKPGKATVQYKYKGKTYKHTYIVQKYMNPAKTLKIGAKDYASKLKKTNYLCLSPATVQGKSVLVKPISGWQLKKTTITREKNNDTTQIRKGAKFKLTKYDTALEITWYCKKTNMYHRTYLDFMEE